MKNQFNNQKSCLFNEKIAKTAAAFMQNKPNFKNIKIAASPFMTNKYEISPAWRGENQTQFKPNTNPIAEKAIIGLSSFMTSKYAKFEDLAGQKNKPNTKPKQTQFYAYSHNSIVIALIIRYLTGFITNWNQVDWTLTDMILIQILQPNCVKVPIENKEKEAAITELVDLLDTNGLLLDRDVALDAVLTRERIRSTGTGAGIAIPHGKCNAVKELIMAIGITHEPIEFGSVDGKPVRILILLVSPADQTGPHIQALAGISRLMLNEEFKQKLEQAASAEEVYGFLNEIEK